MIVSLETLISASLDLSFNNKKGMYIVKYYANAFGFTINTVTQI